MNKSKCTIVSQVCQLVELNYFSFSAQKTPNGSRDQLFLVNGVSFFLLSVFSRMR
ncbi:hypothetical protein D068_cds32360 [Bacillus atrophaeus UCMB-5137]|nr:hypothetical protein D068_cds32360 [Bacillus atrophaeus UCMB-5137]